MWKIFALIAAITLGSSAGLKAAEPATPEARLKQMEEIGAVRSRINYKMDEVRRMLVAVQRADGLRFNLASEGYQKIKASLTNKVNAENAKPLKDQATLDACTAKIQSVDDTWNKILAPAYNVYNTRYQEQYQVILGQLNSVSQLGGYDDYMNRAEVELQAFVDLVHAIEARVDVAKAKLTEMDTDFGKALDEAEAVCKE